MVSRYLGAKKIEDVNYTVGNSFLLLAIFGLIFSIYGFIFTEKIVEWFGATEAIGPYATTYIRILFLGSLYFPFCIAGNNLLRAEGNAREAMYLMLIGFAVNLVLDYILIFPLNMGMAGAAIATVLAKLTSFIYLIYYFLSKKTSIKIRIKYLKPQKKIIKEMLSIGFSGFAMAAAGSLVIVIVNHLLGHYGGDIAIAVYGIIYKIVLFIVMPIIGINQGMQPIIGYNYGAGRNDMVIKAVKLSLIYSTIFVSVGVIIGELFPANILKLFSDDPELLLFGKNVLRIVISMIWLVSLQITGTIMFQSLGKAVPSFFLSILRQVILFLPLIFILPQITDWGVYGIWVAFPIVDLIASTITGFLLFRQLRKLAQDT